MPRTDPSTSETMVIEPRRNQFGAFGGVFTPSILTILGIIMFLRAGFVVGQAGIGAALIILVIAKTISLLTALSVCATSTNTEVRGGGSYFLISRALGPEFGGAVGVSMFLAQALAVPFYVMGFTEALTRTFPQLEPQYFFITMGTLVVLLVVVYVGADWAIRVQYLIMAALGLAILAFLGGAIRDFDPALLAANWRPAYTTGHNFWIIFAIYFPAVTGMDAGLNMSGDLKNPARALPRGILSAVGVGAVVYCAQILLCGGSSPRADLMDRPFDSLVDQALFGAGYLVVAGVFAASLSSALGSILGSPRILQALARDNIIPVLRPFAHGARKGDEPRRALLLTFVIGVAVLFYAGGGGGGAALNFVARIITMFFLCVYGITNLAAFVESFGLNPSFRPRFRLFHWTTALLGALGCIAAAFLIDLRGAAAALLVLAALFSYVKRRRLETSYGDARRGFVYSQLRSRLFALDTMPVHAKNWRPTVLVMVGKPERRLSLIHYGEKLAGQRGIVSLAQIVAGDMDRVLEIRSQRLERLREFITRHELQAFPEVVVMEDFDQGMATLLQAHSIGPIKPNILLMGHPSDPERFEPVARHVRTATRLGMSAVILVDRGVVPRSLRRRIDVWWRGRKNGSLMLILAHLLTLDWEWNRVRVRVLRHVTDPAEQEKAEQELRDLAEAGRIRVDIEVVVSGEPFREVLLDNSGDAALVMLGFLPPDRADAREFGRRTGELTSHLPTTLFVSSSGRADLLA